MKVKNEFYGQEGSVAFILPFLFSSEERKETNRCIELFKKIKVKENNKQYDELKRELKNILFKQFPKAEIYYTGTSILDRNDGFIRTCHLKNLCKEYESYKGRNLCPCFSIIRKFHDDPSKDIQRLEIYLGSHHIRYETGQSDKFFEFHLDSLLLLSNERGGECGYVVFNISLPSINENCIYPLTENSLDRIIFLKHLFYKNKLKCTIDTVRNTTIQDWANEYFDRLLVTLGVRKRSKNYNKKNKTVPFSYSIIEINNIIDRDHGLLPLSDILEYKNQLYGLMVSDEGWRFIPKMELEEKFKNNHWSSRTFSNAFFLDHNALIINQYDEVRRSNIEVSSSFESFSEKWFSLYKQSKESDFYYTYHKLRPCLPGMASLVFSSFLKAIYKETVLSKVKELSDTTYITDEEKYKKLASTLQQHSMSLKAIKDIDDCIFYQFGIQDNLNNLLERYNQEANNVQNNKISNLTHITAVISLFSLLVATLAIGVKGSLFSLGMYWTVYLLVIAVVTPLLSYIFIQKRIWNKYKRKHYVKNNI